MITFKGCALECSWLLLNLPEVFLDGKVSMLSSHVVLIISSLLHTGANSTENDPNTKYPVVCLLWGVGA